MLSRLETRHPSIGPLIRRYQRRDQRPEVGRLEWSVERAKLARVNEPGFEEGRYLLFAELRGDRFARDGGEKEALDVLMVPSREDVVALDHQALLGQARGVAGLLIELACGCLMWLLAWLDSSARRLPEDASIERVAPLQQKDLAMLVLAENADTCRLSGSSQRQESGVGPAGFGVLKTGMVPVLANHSASQADRGPLAESAALPAGCSRSCGALFRSSVAS